MKSKLFISAFLALVYLAQANNFNLILLVGKNVPDKITGEITINLHGPEHSQKYTFKQTEFEYIIQGIPGTIEFPDKDVEYVDVTWSSKSNCQVKISVLIVENENTEQSFKPIKGLEVILKNGETASLMKYF